MNYTGNPPYREYPSSTLTTEARPPGVQYEIPDEVLHCKPPVCFICHERKYCYVSLPYGSDYDGEIICGDCCHKHFDPVIKTVLAEKEDTK